MSFIYKSIAWILNICYKAMFSNYALALLLFALIVKVLMLPLGIKQHSNSLKQASLRPKEAAIVKKYKGRNDRVSSQKRQLEIQELQRKAGYSQLAGCLPLLVQFPIVILIYNVIRKPLSYICGFGKDVLAAITAINGKTDEIEMLTAMRGAPEAYLGIPGIGAQNAAELTELLPNFMLFRVFDLGLTPSWTSLLVFIPLLNFASTFLTSKLMRKLSYQSPVQQTGGADMKTSFMIMDLVMPLMSTWIAFSVPAAIGIYWIFQNLLGLLQQFIMVKTRPYPVFTEEDYKEAEREILGKKKKNKRGMKSLRDPSKPYVPSLHHIDDDEYNAKVVMPEPTAQAQPKTKAGKMLGGGKMKIYTEDKKPGGSDSDNSDGDKE